MSYKNNHNQLLFVDNDSGEKIGEKRKIYTPSKVEPFMRINIDKICFLLSNLSGKEIKVLSFVLLNMRKTDNRLYISYEKIAKELGISKTSVNSAFQKFQDMDFIATESYGKYIISSLYIFKGDNDKKSKAFEEFYRIKHKIEEDREFISVDTETGEVVCVYKNVIPQSYAEPFVKIYLDHLYLLLSDLTATEGKILAYVLRFMRKSDNCFLGTFEEIAENLKISKQTVISSFKKFSEMDFLIRVRNAQYIVSSRYVIKGNDYKRRRINDEFNKIKSNSYMAE